MHGSASSSQPTAQEHAKGMADYFRQGAAAGGWRRSKSERYRPHCPVPENRHRSLPVALQSIQRTTDGAPRCPSLIFLVSDLLGLIDYDARCLGR